jgi:hypothetical protein
MTDFDPTTNRITFGLLTEDEQKLLNAWPHGWEFYSLSQWVSNDPPDWVSHIVYRGKPAPVVTSWYRNVQAGGSTGNILYSSRAEADLNADGKRIGVLRIDTCNGVSTPHLEDI